MTTPQGMLADWDDPQVQIVYNLLCDGELPPNREEHWEGYVSRRIIAALRTRQAAAPRGQEALEKCDWPVGEFSFMDEPGEHDPCYVVMPGGAMLSLNHHAGEGVDIARAHFIIDACNAALRSEGNEDFSRKVVGDAMRDAWNEICADTDCHPLDITHQGKKLFFEPDHWAELTAKLLFVQSIRASLTPAVAPDGAGRVTDEMVERAWAAIVGADIAPTCFNASIIRADLRTALGAALAQAQEPGEDDVEFVNRYRQASYDANRNKRHSPPQVDSGREEIARALAPFISNDTLGVKAKQAADAILALRGRK